MNIVPKASRPSQAAGTNPNPAQIEKRAAAIAAFQNAGQQDLPVSNPSRVSPEEMGALGRVGHSEPPAVSEPAAAPEATSPKSEEQAPLSSQYAQLARKEKAIRAKAQQLRAQEEAFKAREDALKAKESTPLTPPTQSLKDKLAKGPQGKMEVLNELQAAGFTYEEITQLMLNQPSHETTQLYGVIDELRDELKSLRGDQENSKKSQAEQQQKAYAQAVTQIRNEVKQIVAGSEEFETVRETSSVDDVVELIEETFKLDGVLLSTEEACRAVEEHLVEEATKLAKLKKIQARLAPVAPPAAAHKPNQQQHQTKTLTNSISTTKPMSARDRAIAAMEGRLKS